VTGGGNHDREDTIRVAQLGGRHKRELKLEAQEENGQRSTNLKGLTAARYIQEKNMSILYE